MAQTRDSSTLPVSKDPGRSGPIAWLSGRFERRVLVALAVIVAAGFFMRAGHVLHPDRQPGDDALAYRALAESLYELGTYGAPDFKNPSDWSPGAPLIYAGSYYLTGGVRDGVARGAEALFGTGTIVLAFFLTAGLTGPRRRPGGPVGRDRPAAGFAPVLAAALVAFYPPFVTAPGSLMSEPPAEFMLPAAILASLYADRRGGPASWILPGLLFGVTTLIRPEYMAITACFGLFVLIRRGLAETRVRGLLAMLVFGFAALVPIVPWTVHNYVTLDRLVPLTTGSGKALFTGTYRPGDGEYSRVKAALLEKQTGRRLKPGSPELDRVDPVPLFDRVAERYPQLDRDAALARIGRQNLEQYLRDDPFGYLGMTVRKTWRMWGSTSSGMFAAGLGALVQKLLVLSGLAGLALLAWRRRWEAIALAIPIVGLTVIASLTLAPPRRNEILMTLILPLASVAFFALLDRLRPDPGPDRPDQALPETESAS